MRRKHELKNEIFEITDYTNSTEFEEFIYSVEQVIESWGISKGRSWNETTFPEFNRSESLVYNSQSFRLTHSTIHVDEDFKPLQQAHFPSKTHCLNRWYGFSEFLILSPETTEDAIYFLDSSKLLLSSLASALTRTQCSIPLFIQLGSPSKRFYSGIWLNHSIQTTLEMVLLKSPPPQCSSLKEILCFYKRSIPCAVSPFPQTYISVRYTFSLHNFVGCLADNFIYTQSESSILSLPFGTIRDPIQDFLLATTWIGFSEHLISDSETGELDPLKASSWSLRSISTSNSFCMLYNYIDYMMSLLANDSTLIALLGTSVDDNIEVDVSSAFRNLTKTPPLLQVSALDITMLPGKLLGTYGAFVNKDLLASFMHHIFEDPYSEESIASFRSNIIKSCPNDSITYRIVISLCLVLCNHGGIKGFAQLWRCIVEQFRFHYEKSKLIPGASSQPDPGYSLLHQKIQMLNACITQKIERESALYTSTEGDDMSQHQSVHPTLQLLLTGEKLCVPITQRHAPMTEDMQEEHMEALAKLGSDAEGSRLRAQLHSLSLLSDMQAFKAANTNCRLEDFIRWYSPRDWVSVPITQPIIPDSANCDLMMDAADRGEPSMDVNSTSKSEQSNTEFDNIDADGNTDGNTVNDDENSSAMDCIEGSVDREHDNENESVKSDDRKEEAADDVLSAKEEAADDDDVLSAKDIEMEEKLESPTKETELTKLAESELDPGTSPNNEQEACSTNDKESNSDDEFLDAEDEFDIGDNSEKSDNIFKSASETSDRIISASPPGGRHSEEDEFALSHISEDNDAGHDSSDSKMEKLINESKMDKQPVDDELVKPKASPFKEHTIKYEQPLDPNVYGGHLSARMAKESVWKEVWYVAKPIPIWHQKRLFDDTKEIERILHYFTHCQIKNIALLIIPPLLHAAYDRITECPDGNASFVKERLDAIHKKLKDLHRYPSDDTDYFKDILSDIYDCELTLSKFYSLRNKLSHQEDKAHATESTKRLTELERRTRRNMKGSRLTSRVAESSSVPEVQASEDELLQELITSEVELPGAVRSCWGSVLQRLFHAQLVAASNKSSVSAQPRHVPIFPLPVGREYILQTVTRHPASVSRECPQRMFVTVSGNEFRVAYANSSDKTFL